MPGFLTHWRVLIETAKRSQDAGNDLGSLVIDASALHRRALGPATPPQTPPVGAVWNTGPLPLIDFTFPGSDISAMAYLGAMAPDVSYYQGSNFNKMLADDMQNNRSRWQPTASGDFVWGDLLHCNRSGDVLLAFLEHIADIPSPALRSQALAFAMGYLSHIATDIALNPCINALASAYNARDIAGIFKPLGIHFYVELCLDEYLADTYFEHPLYSWLGQPWVRYIEPVAAQCTKQHSIPSQVLDLLTDAAEVTYALTETQSQSFRRDWLVGVQRLRKYLAGSGSFRLFTLKALSRKRREDPILAGIANTASEPGTVDFEQAVSYAIHLSEHLCRRAISYYAALRNTTATANERNRRRTALCEDLRNWNLHTGYVMDVTFDEQITVHFLHNWVYFARLWENEREAVVNATHR
ncbi:MAG: zinc dependent phospholipase C family protein [Ktedonobacteraceae bacterium]